jgi:hypothetical protein
MPKNGKDDEEQVSKRIVRKLLDAKRLLLVADGLSYPFDFIKETNQLVDLLQVPAMSLTAGKGKSPHLSVSGRNIFITGGGSGIGARTALSFAEAGATCIVILGRTEERLLATKEKVSTQYPNTKILVYAVDITTESGVQKAFSRFVSAAGKIDVLISNAGFGDLYLELRTWTTYPGSLPSTST